MPRRSSTRSLGCAVHTTLPLGVGYTSLGLEVKYVRPITRDTGRVLCEGTVVHRGRKQATAEARLTSEDSGKLLATGTSTLMIFGDRGDRRISASSVARVLSTPRSRVLDLLGPPRSRLSRQVADQLDQQADAVAAAALAGVGAADVPGGAGDVDVRPGGVVDELLEEGGGGDRARLALAAPGWRGRRPCPSSSSLYSGWRGRRQTSSPLSSPAADSSAASASSLEMTAA